jgi:polyisoprenoid-binding protein YceI
MKIIKNTALLLTALATTSFTLPAFAADKYEFDKSHTKILFYINHLGYSETIGEFTDYDGNFTFDQKKPEESSIDVTLKPSGIRTSSTKLDSELQGEKFFKSDQFPTIKFVSEKVTRTGDNTGEVDGIATMLGVSKPTKLKVRFNKADYHPFTKNFVAGFSASATLKRSDFGMKEYLPLVGDEVRIEVQTEGVNIDRKKQEEVKK